MEETSSLLAFASFILGRHTSKQGVVLLYTEIKCQSIRQLQCRSLLFQL